MQGTNFGTAKLTDTVNPLFVDSNGYGVLVTAPSSALVTTAGFGIGCLLVDTTIGKLYINTGNTTTPTWTVVGSQS